MEESIKQRDLKCKKEVEGRDEMSREELLVKDVAFWEESGMQEYELCKIQETRDRNMKESLVSREKAWLDRLHHCSESLRLMTQEHINKRTIMESIGKRQCEMTKANTKILN